MPTGRHDWLLVSLRFLAGTKALAIIFLLCLAAWILTEDWQRRRGDHARYPAEATWSIAVATACYRVPQYLLGDSLVHLLLLGLLSRRRPLLALRRWTTIVLAGDMALGVAALVVWMAPLADTPRTSSVANRAPTEIGDWASGAREVSCDSGIHRGLRVTVKCPKERDSAPAMGQRRRLMRRSSGSNSTHGMWSRRYLVRYDLAEASMKRFKFDRPVAPASGKGLEGVFAVLWTSSTLPRSCARCLDKYFQGGSRLCAREDEKGEAGLGFPDATERESARGDLEGCQS